MKKILIAMLVATIGIVASAASYNWKASNDWYSPDGNDDLSGTAYIFDGSIYGISAVIDGLSGGSLGNALQNQALSYGAFDMNGTGLTDDGADAAHMFVVVVNDAGDGYWASTMQDIAINDAIKGGATASFAFGSVENVSFTAMPTPEPTSGLLLLLGMAGLALKRKRA